MFTRQYLCESSDSTSEGEKNPKDLSPMYTFPKPPPADPDPAVLSSPPAKHKSPKQRAKRPASRRKKPWNSDTSIDPTPPPQPEAPTTGLTASVWSNAFVSGKKDNAPGKPKAEAVPAPPKWPDWADRESGDKGRRESVQQWVAQIDEPSLPDPDGDDTESSNGSVAMEPVEWAKKERQGLLKKSPSGVISGYEATKAILKKEKHRHRFRPTTSRGTDSPTWGVPSTPAGTIVETLLAKATTTQEVDMIIENEYARVNNFCQELKRFQNQTVSRLQQQGTDTQSKSSSAPGVQSPPGAATLVAASQQPKQAPGIGHPQQQQGEEVFYDHFAADTQQAGWPPLVDGQLQFKPGMATGSGGGLATSSNQFGDDEDFFDDYYGQTAFDAKLPPPKNNQQQASMMNSTLGTMGTYGNGPNQSESFQQPHSSSSISMRPQNASFFSGLQTNRMLGFDDDDEEFFDNPNAGLEHGFTPVVPGTGGNEPQQALFLPSTQQQEDSLSPSSLTPSPAMDNNQTEQQNIVQSSHNSTSNTNTPAVSAVLGGSAGGDASTPSLNVTTEYLQNLLQSRLNLAADVSITPMMGANTQSTEAASLNGSTGNNPQHDLSGPSSSSSAPITMGTAADTTLATTGSQQQPPAPLQRKSSLRRSPHSDWIGGPPPQHFMMQQHQLQTNQPKQHRTTQPQLGSATGHQVVGVRKQPQPGNTRGPVRTAAHQQQTTQQHKPPLSALQDIESQESLLERELAELDSMLH
eukprot:TRINITY_DN5092_c0_g1_i1.p1 TRINITY_DN5092_c0_g1~~TRINITY_DN5092_c0_g1_i1.p1  ORF type:complete len:748 (-),score=119.57 TRINITY_DN5092_c0_g1_i1:303-2546(-)